MATTLMSTDAKARFALIVFIKDHLGSHKQRHTIAQGLYVSGAKKLDEAPTRSAPTWAPNRGLGRFT